MVALALLPMSWSRDVLRYDASRLHSERVLTTATNGVGSAMFLGKAEMARFGQLLRPEPSDVAPGNCEVARLALAMESECNVNPMVFSIDDGPQRLGL